MIADDELQRLQGLMIFESQARQRGYKIVAGVDEAGRGPLAGPVVAAACVLPEGWFAAGIDDSKKLTPKKRQAVFNKLTKEPAIDYSIGVVGPGEIDKINIYQATMKAMLKAVDSLRHAPDALLVDGLRLLHPSIYSQKICKGDQLSLSIAAASIIAKVTRDRLMLDYHQIWPQYGFDHHKGYGTAQHLAAIAKWGGCPIHRMTFSPLNAQKQEVKTEEGTPS